MTARNWVESEGATLSTVATGMPLGYLPSRPEVMRISPAVTGASRSTKPTSSGCSRPCPLRMPAERLCWANTAMWLPGSVMSRTVAAWGLARSTRPTRPMLVTMGVPGRAPEV